MNADARRAKKKHYCVECGGECRKIADAVAQAVKERDLMLQRIADAKDSMVWWADLDRILNELHREDTP